jgi:hypothetical protein
MTKKPLRFYYRKKRDYFIFLIVYLTKFLGIIDNIKHNIGVCVRFEIHTIDIQTVSTICTTSLQCT